MAANITNSCTQAMEAANLTAVFSSIPVRYCAIEAQYKDRLNVSNYARLASVDISVPALASVRSC